MSPEPTPSGTPDGGLVPVASDVDSAVRLGREAVLGRPWIGDQGPALADRFENGVRTGSATGGLLRVGDRAVGIAMWERHDPLGLTVDLLFLGGTDASPALYRRFLEEIRRTAGPIAFAPGAVPGLRPSEEERLMVDLGFARYGRSEMQRSGDLPLPSFEMPARCSARPVDRRDEVELVELHRRAYHDRFDRYLFLEDEDERTDSVRLVRDLFGGRWGEPSIAGSLGIEQDRRLVGAILSVHRSSGVLIADVMVDPAAQGQGIGKAVLAETLRSLAVAGESPVVLNVTEGNARALRLYERLGFVRTLGPSQDWYDRRRIPVAPETG